MGWEIGYDDKWKRDIGYGVPAYCDHPGCNAEIDRGLAYVCGNEQPYGGDDGCGLFFCSEHLTYHEKRGRVCECCADHRKTPFTAKPDHPDWINWKLTDDSWQQWRDENPEEVAKICAELERACAGNRRK
jgi:hypothetical protein